MLFSYYRCEVTDQEAESEQESVTETDLQESVTETDLQTGISNWNWLLTGEYVPKPFIMSLNGLKLCVTIIRNGYSD